MLSIKAIFFFIMWLTWLWACYATANTVVVYIPPKPHDVHFLSVIDDSWCTCMPKPKKKPISSFFRTVFKRRWEYLRLRGMLDDVIRSMSKALSLTNLWCFMNLKDKTLLGDCDVIQAEFREIIFCEVKTFSSFLGFSLSKTFFFSFPSLFIQTRKTFEISRRSLGIS